MSIRNKDALWVVLDLETTGLDPVRDRILEVAALLVNRDLVVLDYIEGVLDCSKEAFLSYCPEGSFVHKMHTDNGLAKQCDAGGMTDGEADDMLYRWLVTHCATDGSVQLIGNSIDFDIGFIRRQMLKTYRLLHHRCINISTINVLEEAWSIGARVRTQTTSDHRAMGDAQDSLNQLRAYKAKFWPGPVELVGTEECK
jgi:oligoribonuclease